MRPVVLLEMSAEPAFASDEDGRILLWNAEATRLLGHEAADVIGRPCSEVIQGEDLFGNRYCVERCNPRQMLARHGPVHGFELDVPTASGQPVRVAFSIIVVQGPSPSAYTIVHLMRPIARPQAGEHVAEADRTISPPLDPVEPAPERIKPSLSKREIEILRLASDGRSTAQIATGLSLSAATVRTHVQNILRKLDAHSKLEAVAIARRQRLL